MVQTPRTSSPSFPFPGSSQGRCLGPLSHLPRSAEAAPLGLPVASAIPRVLQWVQPRRPWGTWSAVDFVLQSFPLGTELKRHVPTERRLLWAYRLDQVINWGANGVVFRARLVLKVQGNADTSARSVAIPTSTINNLLPTLDKAFGNGDAPLATDASVPLNPPSSAPVTRRATNMLQSLFRFGSLGQAGAGSDPQAGKNAFAQPVSGGAGGEEMAVLGRGRITLSTPAFGKEQQQPNVLHPATGGWYNPPKKSVEGSEVSQGTSTPPVRNFVTNRPVAVKILTTYPPSAGSKDISLRSATTLRAALDRAAFEAVLLSQLDHPGIVAFVDSFTAPPSFCIVVQEYLVGSVRRLCQELGPLPEWAIAFVLHDILGALNYLHSDFNRATSLSCVHRDVKTANLLLSSTARAKLVDFGVAVLVPSPGAPGSSTCSFNVGTTFAGTPKWMAPEQAMLFNEEGRPAEDYAITPAADIWALGISVIEMATSHLPKELDGLDQEQTLRMVGFNESYVPRLADGVYIVGANRSGSARKSKGSFSGGAKADTCDSYNISPSRAAGSPGEPVMQTARTNRLQVIEAPARNANRRLSPTSQPYRVKLSFSNELKDFVAACVKRDPKERATAEALLAHPFLKINEKNIRQRPVSYRELFIRLSKEATRRRESGEKIKSSDEEEKRSGGTSPRGSCSGSSAPPLQNTTAPYKQQGEGAASNSDSAKPPVLNPPTHCTVQTSLTSRGLRSFQIGKFLPLEAVERLLLPYKRSSEDSETYTISEPLQPPDIPDLTPSPVIDALSCLPDKTKNARPQPWSVLELLAIKHSNNAAYYSDCEGASPQTLPSPAPLKETAKQLNESPTHGIKPSSVPEVPFFLPAARFTFSSRTKMPKVSQAALPEEAVAANVPYSRPLTSDRREISLSKDPELVLTRRSDCVTFQYDSETCAPQNIKNRSFLQEHCSLERKSRWDTAMQKRSLPRVQYLLSSTPYVSGGADVALPQGPSTPFRIFSDARRTAMASVNGARGLNSSKYGGQKIFASKTVLGSLNEDSDSVPSVFSEELPSSPTSLSSRASQRVPLCPVYTENAGGLDVFFNWNRRHINKPTASACSVVPPHLSSAHSTFESVQECASSAVSRILHDEDSADFCTVESESPLSTQGSAEFIHVADAISNVTPGSLCSRQSLVSPAHGNSHTPLISSGNAFCIPTQSAVSLESRVADND